jgi:NADP-dependent 3-hydroxy acid dehydrogenase YdfG/aryl carrier-like protein
MSNNSTFCFSPNATYVVTGGLGGIGRSIARWLCSRGAMNLILITRSGLSGNSKGEEMVSELTSRGVRVDCPEIDITDLATLQSYFTKCSQTMPPIKGCFQSAMVLRDTTLSNMSIDDWTQAIRPKVQGSWNLHECLPPMDFFILLSSVVGVGGNRGQANYAAGSGFEDSFARWRSTHCNQKTISVDLGFVLGEGVVAENDDLIKLFIRRNVVRPNSLTEIFTLFESICDPANLQRSEEDSQIITGMKLPAHTLAQGNEVPPELLLPIFRIMCQMDGEHGALSTVSGQTQSFRALFAAASSTDEGSSIASAALREKLGRILGVKAEELQTDRPLSQYGIDSLVALEIRSWVGREMETDVAIFEVLGEATIDSIGRIVGMKSKLKA